MLPVEPPKPVQMLPCKMCNGLGYAGFFEPDGWVAAEIGDCSWLQWLIKRPCKYCHGTIPMVCEYPKPPPPPPPPPKKDPDPIAIVDPSYKHCPTELEIAQGRTRMHFTHALLESEEVANVGTKYMKRRLKYAAVGGSMERAKADVLS